MPLLKKIPVCLGAIFNSYLAGLSDVLDSTRQDAIWYPQSFTNSELVFSSSSLYLELTAAES